MNDAVGQTTAHALRGATHGASGALTEGEAVAAYVSASPQDSWPPIEDDGDMARPDRGLPEFRGAWCEGCGEALQQTEGGDWIHLLIAGRLPSMQCDPAEVRVWQEIKAGRGL